MTSVTEEMIEAAWTAWDKASGYSKPERLRAALEAALSASPAAQTEVVDDVARGVAFDIIVGHFNGKLSSEEIEAIGATIRKSLAARTPSARREVRPDRVLVRDEKTGEAVAVARPRYDLDELLKGHDPATNHGEVWSESAPSAPQPTEPVAWRCDGCGWLAKDAAADLKALRDAGHVSCCPERKMLPLYLDSHVAQQRDDGWQDIATAPKDGTWFLGWAERPDVEDQYDIWHWDAEAETDAGYGFWINAADSNLDEYPTHWKPLESPPAFSPERKDQSNGA